MVRLGETNKQNTGDSGYDDSENTFGTGKRGALAIGCRLSGYPRSFNGAANVAYSPLFLLYERTRI